MLSRVLLLGFMWLPHFSGSLCGFFFAFLSLIVMLLTLFAMVLQILLVTIAGFVPVAVIA